MKRSKKMTFGKYIEAMDASLVVVVPIPLNGEIGVINDDHVEAYQIIGVANGVYYFSPCSGSVHDAQWTVINERGEEMQGVLIRNDRKDECTPLSTTDVDVKERIAESGLNGIFEGEKFLLIGSDDKYYINNDDAILRSFSDKINHAIDYVKSFASLCTNDKGFAKRFGLKFALDGKKVTLGDLYNLSLAVEDGIPYVYKIMTVAGEAIKEPKVLRVPIGTDYFAVLDACGGEIFPNDEYHKMYDLAKHECEKVAELKEKLKTADSGQKSHIKKELVALNRKSNHDIMTVLKTEKKYKNVLLSGIVYGDYVNGVGVEPEFESFSKPVTGAVDSALFLNEKQYLRRKKK